MKEGLGTWVLVQLGAKREAGNVLDPLEGRPVGQKVKGVAQQYRLGVGNRLHSRHVADYFGLDEKNAMLLERQHRPFENNGGFFYLPSTQTHPQRGRENIFYFVLCIHTESQIR